MKAFLVTLESEYDRRTITFIEQGEYDSFLKRVRQLPGVHVTDIVERCAATADVAMESVGEMLVESDEEDTVCCECGTCNACIDRAEAAHERMIEDFHDGGSGFRTADERHREAWEQKQALRR